MGLKRILKKLGPGLVTGAADDDPSGIATYSQGGAEFGNRVLWTMLFSYPLMCAVQELSGRVGRVTGRGLAGNMRRHYPAWLLYGIVLLTALANTLNVAADLAAMAEAAKLLLGGPLHLYGILVAGICLFIPMYFSYPAYANFLRWLTLVLFAYVATAFAVKLHWGDIIKSTLMPWKDFQTGQVRILVAILGTTISPYLFFWQAAQEMEEVKAAPREDALKGAPSQAPYQFERIRVDTYSGMAISNLIAFFIMLTTSATLHASGKTQIDTAAQAAEALRPLAGSFAFTLFALGIIGTGLLAVPVLAGSTAYALSEAFKWKVGLSRNPLQAKGFYGVMTLCMVLGVAINFTHINPIKALVWSAIVNGVVAAPILFVLMLMVSNRKVMGEFTVSGWLKWCGWFCTGIMTIAALAMFFV
jgi:NRAMP (natural resistance-associated macrophage protein)-like metal ion transporter